MFDNKPESIEQDGACIFSGIIGGEVLKKLENVGECGMLGVFSHDGVFLFWFLKRIQLVAEHFKLFPGHGTLGEREIQEVGNCTNSKDVLRFYRQNLTPPTR